LLERAGCLIFALVRADDARLNDHPAISILDDLIGESSPDFDRKERRGRKDRRILF